MVVRINDLWSEYWDARIADQEVWKQLCFYSMMSTLIQSVNNEVADKVKTEQDLRVHPFFVCNSSSGKGLGLYATHTVLKEILGKKKVSIVSSTTDAGLLDSRELREKWNEKKTATIKKYCKKKGPISSNNWIGFEEEETLHSKNNLDTDAIFRVIMDGNTYSRNLKGCNIEIDNKPSFVWTVQPHRLDYIKTKMYNGFFHRCLFYSKNVDFSVINRKVIECLFGSKEKQSSDWTLVPGYYDLLKELKIIISEYKSREDKSITSSDDLKEYVDSLVMKLESTYPDNTVFQSMVTRNLTNTWKLAKINAIIEGKSKLERTHIDVAFNLVKTCLLAVQEFVLKLPKDDYRKLAILEFIRSKKTVSIDDITDFAWKKLKIHYGTWLKLVQGLEKESLIKVIESKPKKWQLVEDNKQE